MITRINEYSSVNKTGSVGKKKSVSGTGGGDFLGLLGAAEVDNTQIVSSPSDITSINNIDSLLTLQEMPDEEVSKRKAVKQSEIAIDSLDSLRHAIINDSINENIINRLGEDIANLKQQFVGDKKLLALIQDIELRAAVEQAKLEYARKLD
ncbi:MAG: flagellar assembly protein FliX [Pseudomonadota bacterium]